MSPHDSRLLAPLDAAEPKLKGIGTGHFAAFFKRRYRENDYLWGRLDAAERIVGLVLGDAGPRLPHVVRARRSTRSSPRSSRCSARPRS